MVNPDLLYEVEIRCYFSNLDEACSVLPFLSSCIQRENTWFTVFYGLELFRSGQLLRVGELTFNDKASYYIGWKGPDIGEFANIRQEIDEEITGGITNSLTMKQLGGSENIGTHEEAIRDLARLGHHEFMSFWGKSEFGEYESSGIGIKLMTCPPLKWPVTVEFEKTAATEEEAKRCDKELMELSRELKLQDRLVREEPPSLLYASIYND